MSLIPTKWATPYDSDLVFSWSGQVNSTAPLTGPTLTKTGTPTMAGGSSKRWRWRGGPGGSGGLMLGTDFGVGENLIHLVGGAWCQPAADVCVILQAETNEAFGNVHAFASTRAAGRGWRFALNASGRVTIQVEGDTDAGALGGVATQIARDTPFLAIATIDRTGNVSIYLDEDSTAKGTVGCPAGSLNGDGIAINAATNGAADRATTIYRLQVFHCADVTTYDVGALQQLILNGKGF